MITFQKMHQVIAPLDYKPLDVGHFRLISMHSQGAPQSGCSTSQLNSTALKAESENPVRCSLLHASLKDSPPYTALSYCWGNSEERRQIFVDSVAIHVTVNLELALRHLRGRSEFQVLWIDALCIDQKNHSEKGEQLEQMREIYTRASLVISWLGPAQDNSDTAMSWISLHGGLAARLEIGKTRELRLQSVLEAYESSTRACLSQPLQDFATGLTQSLSTEAGTPTHVTTALSYLCDRAYWSRIWIVQEVVSASELLFMCGNKTVSEDEMNYALRLLRNVDIHTQSRRGSDTSVGESFSAVSHSVSTSKQISLMKIRRISVATPLIHLLRTFRHLEATDPRDKLFALLGIASDTQELDIHPDYRKSWREVYTNLTRKLVQHGYFEVLTICEATNQLQNLQSWVCDLSTKRTKYTLQQRSIKRRKRPITTILEPTFSASGFGYSTETQQTDDLEDSQWQRPLQLRAIVLGSVQKVGTEWESDQYGVWLSNLRDLAAVIPDDFLQGHTREHAVWRTAVADQEVRQVINIPRLTAEEISRVHSFLSITNLQSIDDDQLAVAGLGDYSKQLQHVAQFRRPLYISGGYLGIGPSAAEPGDIACIILGADTPYILRPKYIDNHFMLLGEAYIDGVMDGEAMTRNLEIQNISLD